jgi:hypothetical protein
MHIIRKIILFILCGTIYCGIELVYRQYTHYSMFALSGILGVLCIDSPNNIFGYDLDYLIQVLISTLLCTLGEGITGIIVNIRMELDVWDYSTLPFTFFWGQCNLFFVFAWALIIGLFGIFFCDAYWYYICKDEEQPYYKLFGREFFRMPLKK